MTAVLVKKEYSDELFQSFSGKFFDSSYYDNIFKKDIDVYYEDKQGNLKILVKLRKNVIPESMRDEMRGIFENHAKRKNNQRAKAAGGKRITVGNVTKSDTIVRSNIVGYYDKPKMMDKRYFNTGTVCRTTAFTKNNIDAWEKSIPFFNVISNYYEKLAPEEYRLQNEAVKESPFRISSTPFTTVTVNYNWRTACHKDKGDFIDGMGNLVVLGQDYDGGYLGFPQFKIAVDVQPGDLVIMNVHEWHCNTELDLNSESVRLSFVCYMRQNMVECNKKKVINGEVMYYKD